MSTARSVRLALLLAATSFATCHPSAERSSTPGEAVDEPRTLWTRKLGSGYSGIVGQEDRLYTMYRDDRHEVVIALDARTGKTVWEFRYESEPVEGQDVEYGDGPNAAPLLSGDRLYTVGFSGLMHALDRESGRLVWSRDLWGELGGNVVELGYSSSPVEYGDTIIALVGGEGRGAVAFDRNSGDVVWKNLDFEASYATPVLMRIHGEDQLVAFMATEVVGADPRTGALLWHYAIRNHYPQNICTPLQVDDDLVFVSTLEAGSRGLAVMKDEPFRVEERWSSTRVQCFYGEFAILGDHVYGTSGSGSGPRMAAIDAKTGELAWRRRGFALSHVVADDGHLILLDDKGKLALARPGSDGMKVLWESRVLSAPSLTPPTILGDVLFARDLREIVALDLG